MTPFDFRASYEVLACQITDLLGPDPSAILAQWALETNWSTRWAGFPYNLANIRCSPASFCQYSSLGEFSDAYVAVLQQPNMGVILASVGQPVTAQLTALGVSPWDSGHYGNPPGSALIPYQEALQMATIDDVFAQVTIIHQGLFGNDPAVLPAPSMQRKLDDLWTGKAPPELAVVLSKLDQILALIPASGGGLTPAQDALLVQIGADVAAIRLRTDKDLAP